MRFVPLSCISLALLLFHPAAQAWSGAGHEVIAALAWSELPPEAKAKVTDLLKSHPDYGKWEASFTAGSLSLDFPTFVFMRASKWPDEIRRQGNKYDHPGWHYVDYPLKPPSFPMEPAPSPTDDVLYGIQQCERVLADTKASAEERAVYLSWLIHLVGDIHQPLHCCSLVTETYPAGDKGGNSFYVKPSARGISLHSFWDGLLGTSSKSQAHANDAVEIQTEHPRKSLHELGKRKTPRDWSLDSRSLAIEQAYLRGELKGSTNKDDAPPLPEGYTKAVKAVAERQAALAGFRLADEIKGFLN